jgi:hypothetical protein
MCVHPKRAAGRDRWRPICAAEKGVRVASAKAETKQRREPVRLTVRAFGDEQLHASGDDRILGF